MVDTILRTLLGSAGYAIMQQYIEHALPINIIIFGYLGLIYLGRRSYRAMKKTLQEEFEKATTKSPLSKPEAWFEKTLKNRPINWDNVRASSKIPFYSPDNYFWFSLKNENSMSKHFTPKRIAAWYAPNKDQTKLIQ